VKTIQYNTGQALHETHADGELRNSHKERKCGETQLCFHSTNFTVRWGGKEQYRHFDSPLSSLVDTRTSKTEQTIRKERTRRNDLDQAHSSTRTVTRFCARYDDIMLRPIWY